jgi:peptide chain release factor 1
MFQKLEAVEKRFEELTQKISDPNVIANQNEWREFMKEHAELEPIVEKYREYKKVEKQYNDAKELVDDSTTEKDLKDLAEMEMLEAKEKLPQIEEEIKILLIPKDKDDDKNVICEIRAGAGGEEAALFAGTLFRMYSMYAERKHWKLEILNENETGLGGYKEISFMITGKGAYSRLKFESGVHRVQRVPDTEASGRIHTSTATVAVLPVVEDVEIELNPSDIKMEVFRSSGAGGQHINKTSSAVRLIHEPTGIVVECQTERSQFQNKDNAMRMLKTKLYDMEKQKQDSEVRNARKSQVGSGDRSEKIRTYNYPQGRITDHRIGLSIYQMEDFLNGNLDEMIDNLIAADRAEKLKGDEEE